MYSASDLRADVRQIIETSLAASQALPQHEIVATVLLHHPFPAGWSGPDREFADLCCADRIRHEARKQLREFKAAPAGSTEPPLPFPDLEYVQRAYVIARNGEPTIVPLHLMTDAELDAKADEIEAMSRGTARHAAELRRYRAERGRLAAAAE